MWVCVLLIFCGFMLFNCVCGDLYSTLCNIMIWQVDNFFLLALGVQDFVLGCIDPRQEVFCKCTSSNSRGN